MKGVESVKLISLSNHFLLFVMTFNLIMLHVLVLLTVVHFILKLSISSNVSAGFG